MGVTRIVGVEIEPYTCAVALTDIGLAHIDAIAGSTDIDRLLPPGVSAAELPSAPPDDWIFRSDLRERVAAMG